MFPPKTRNQNSNDVLLRRLWCIKIVTAKTLK